MEIIKIKNKSAVKLAVEAIKKGKVIVCPTDTVYGFLADAENRKAVKKIFKIKKRPKLKPLAVFVKDIEMAKELAEIDEKQEEILKSKWPGKCTFVLKSNNILQTPGVCKNKTIALRIPKYKFLNDLLEKINKPLVQTSVNISGQPPLTKIKEIIKVFNNQKNCPDSIIDAGDLPKNKPSVIMDLTKDKIKFLRK